MGFHNLFYIVESKPQPPDHSLLGFFSTIEFLKEMPLFLLPDPRAIISYFKL
jgi:hypothetical protein